MSGMVDLRKIERKSYLAYLQDGVWDILIGIALLAWGLMLGNPLLGMAGAWAAAIVPVGWAIKKRLTYPRLGHVEFSAERRARQRKIHLRLVVMGMATFLLGVMAFVASSGGSMPDIVGDYMLVIFASLIAFPIALVGYWQGMPRLYGYGLVILASPLIVQLVGGDDRLGFIISGSILTLAGLALMIRFVRRYPRPSKEETIA